MFASHSPIADYNGGARRRRPDDLNELERDSQRRRITPSDSGASDEDGMTAATRGLQQAAIYDEDEMLRQAIEASMQVPQPPHVTDSSNPDRVTWTPASSVIASTQSTTSASDSGVNGIPEDDEPDDEPSLEELRRRRLNRFTR